MYQIAGKVVVITGAAKRGGLGRAMANRFAAEGCSVVISDLGAPSGPQFPEALIGSTTELADAVREVTAGGGKAAAVPCDVRDESQVQNLIASAVSAFGRIDVMVNNAGIGYLMQNLVDVEVKDWDTVMAVNARGTFLGTKHAARQMIEQKQGGRIINIASIAGKMGFGMAAAYNSSKHAVVGLTRTAATELGPHGITVNAICPNQIPTPLGIWQNGFFSQANKLTEEDYLRDMRRRIPMGRNGKTSDIASMAAFLVSEQAEFVTGQALNVDGGEIMH
jgi:meso-butanediol dehydrogenase/(S,S)-butanediol dehydrogenase/diacetyl reductase